MDTPLFPSGSVITTKSVYPLIKHFGIVFYDRNCPYVAHISEITVKPQIIKLADYLNEKQLIDIIQPTGDPVDDQALLKRVNQLQADGKLYNILNNNCEDLVKYVCDCKPSLDQRSVGVVVVGIIALVAIMYYMLKN